MLVFSENSCSTSENSLPTMDLDDLSFGSWSCINGFDFNNGDDDDDNASEFSLGSWSGNGINYGDDDYVSSIEVVDNSEYTHQTYNVYYYNDEINTTVTNTGSVVDEWIENVKSDFEISDLDNLVVGLDIKGDDRKVAILQLCYYNRCLIFQFSCCDNIPDTLNDFLSDENIIFAGAGIDDDVYKLWFDYGLHVARTEELGSLAADNLTKTGLKTLAKEVLDLELPKKRDIHTWENYFLSDAQIKYACLDAFVSFELAFELMRRVNPVPSGEPEKLCKDFNEPEKVSEMVHSVGNWSDDQTSISNTGSIDGSSIYCGSESGGNEPFIEVVDKSDSTYHTYDVYYYDDIISTTVTNTASVVDQWIADMIYSDFQDNLGIHVVGFDIEWSRGTPNKVAVLQLCVSDRCLIFQLGCCDKIPQSLCDFLSSDEFTFVGVGIDFEAQKIEEDYGLKVARVAELGSLAAWHLTTCCYSDFKESQFHEADLKDLAKDFLGQELPKSEYIKMSNWDQDFLSDEQIMHACLDAFVASSIADGLHRNGARGHTS